MFFKYTIKLNFIAKIGWCHCFNSKKVTYWDPPYSTLATHSKHRLVFIIKLFPLHAPFSSWKVSPNLWSDKWVHNTAHNRQWDAKGTFSPLSPSHSVPNPLSLLSLLRRSWTPSTCGFICGYNTPSVPRNTSIKPPWWEFNVLYGDISLVMVHVSLIDGIVFKNGLYGFVIIIIAYWVKIAKKRCAQKLWSRPYLWFYGSIWNTRSGSILSFMINTKVND